MTGPQPPTNYKYISRDRRPREDGRFITGQGRFVQDISLPGMKHIAFVASPYARAEIVNIDVSAALAVPGVVTAITGADLAQDLSPLYHGVALPNVAWYPLAKDMVRYVGEWVVAIVAEDRYIAEDAAELVEVDYNPLTAIIDPEQASEDGAPLVHPDHGSNILLQKNFVWGPLEEDFAAADHTLSYRVKWGRSSSVPIETFGVICQWHEKDDMLEVWASIQMPQYQEQIADALQLPMHRIKIHNDIDVGGSYGVKRGIKQTVLSGYLSQKLGCPIRLIEDRMDNISGGGSHGPDRIFDATLAFNADGEVKAMKLKVLDDIGAYPGRAIQQVGKSISSLCGPYRFNSIGYDILSVATNKTSQVPVRGFGQSPTNYTLERGMDKVAEFLALDRLEIRRRNLIQADQFPWKIPTGTAYDSGDYPTVLDKALTLAGWDDLKQRQHTLRQSGKLAGIGLATCLEPGGGNNIFEHLLNEKIQITTFIESVLLKIDGHGQVTALISTTTSGQGHQTLVATIAGEELQRDPDDIHVVHSDSLNGLPTRSPVASRMAIMLGSATAKAAQKLLHRMKQIAAHNLDTTADEIDYEEGQFWIRRDPGQKIAWNEIVFIAHRQLHRMPDGLEPGLQVLEVHAVPGGGQLPNEKGEVQIYPCFSFQAHVPFVVIDPLTGKVEVTDYYVAHDCGTMINPHIVRGMMFGGIAQGIGAALFEKFDYDAEGQLLSGTFLDYLLPSAHEIPEIEDVDHCTPSPLTSHGQKGAGEGGYLGAPAAIASAVNDALSPLGITIDELPMRPKLIEDLIHHAKPESAESKNP